MFTSVYHGNKCCAYFLEIIAQALYAFGALLCVFNTYVSIVFIVLVQLNYVFAPRIGPLYRI